MQKLYCQNLVPNNSFEIYTICPDNAGQLFYATPWFQPNVINGNTINSSSSDYFNSCTINNTVSTPLNGAGFQLPRTGNAFVGTNFFSYTMNNSTYSREYIECKLLSPLQKGKEYCVSFYISLADSSRYAVSNIGIYFSFDSLLYSSGLYANINVIPQIKNPNTNIIEDKKNWVLISGEYIAEGGEQFITIGNFDNNINTNRKKVSGPLNIAYYYIDDVSVYLCEDTLPIPSDTFYLHIPNIFTPNADGLNDTWQVKAKGVQQLSATVYNRWGALLWQQEVFADTTQNELHLSWSGHSNTGLPSSAGTYFYLVSYTTKEGELKKEKGFLTLTR